MKEDTLSPQQFRTPRRRDTRQRSGFHVSGGHTGSEALLSRARCYTASSSSLVLELINAECACTPQFGGATTLGAVGGYIKAEQDIRLDLSIEAVDPLSTRVIAKVEKSQLYSVSAQWVDSDR